MADINSGERMAGGATFSRSGRGGYIKLTLIGDGGSGGDSCTLLVATGYIDISIWCGLIWILQVLLHRPNQACKQEVEVSSRGVGVQGGSRCSGIFHTDTKRATGRCKLILLHFGLKSIEVLTLQIFIKS